VSSRPEEVNFFHFLILPTALGPGVDSASEMSTVVMFLGSTVRPVR
jgi:hypothetical protein